LITSLEKEPSERSENATTKEKSKVRILQPKASQQPPAVMEAQKTKKEQTTAQP